MLFKTMKHFVRCFLNETALKYSEHLKSRRLSRGFHRPTLDDAAAAACCSRYKQTQRQPPVSGFLSLQGSHFLESACERHT